jgi:TolA-binding protein
VLILDADGVERARIEGYLPNVEFRAYLEMGLARIAFMHKQWPEAERRYAHIEQNYSKSSAAPEAMYWSGVSRYRATNDHKALGEIAGKLHSKYPESIWTKKASIWSH